MGLFGPTKKGGGLDKRFSSNKGGYLGKASRFASSFGGGDDDYDYSNSNDDGEDYLSKFTFEGDVDSICVELDELLKEAEQYGMAHKNTVFSKIESGIFHLERKKAFHEANYYRKRLKKGKRGVIIFIAILIAIIVIPFAYGYLTGQIE